MGGAAREPCWVLLGLRERLEMDSGEEGVRARQELRGTLTGRRRRAEGSSGHSGGRGKGAAGSVRRDVGCGGRGTGQRRPQGRVGMETTLRRDSPLTQRALEETSARP